jgi:hypothetical protein
VRRNSPVLAVVVLLREVFLVISEEGIELDALFEVLYGFEAADVLKEIEVAVGVDAGADKSVPVDALELDVGIVLLEGEVERLAEVDVGTLDGVHVLASHLELVEVEVFGEDLHLNYYYDNYSFHLTLERNDCDCTYCLWPPFSSFGSWLRFYLVLMQGLVSLLVKNHNHFARA